MGFMGLEELVKQKWKIHIKKKGYSILWKDHHTEKVSLISTPQSIGQCYNVFNFWYHLEMTSLKI